MFDKQQANAKSVDANTGAMASGSVSVGTDKGRNNTKHSLRKSRKHVPIRVLIPNCVTVVSMCCALIGIRYALIGNLEAAVFAILLATALDAIDGRIARLLKGSTEFGANLDSLADVINFGVAPSIILYVWAQPLLGALAWLVLMAYTICIALRLARFNSEQSDNRAQWQKNYFTGVPAPLGAMLVMVPIYLWQNGMSISVATTLVAVYTPVVSWLCVSSLPTVSSKQLGSRIGIEYGFPIMIAVAVAVSLLLVYPWAMLCFLSVIYVASIPLSMRSYSKRLALTETREAGRFDLHSESKSDVNAKPDSASTTESIDQGEGDLSSAEDKSQSGDGGSNDGDGKVVSPAAFANRVNSQG